MTGKLFDLTGLVFFLRNMFMSLFLLYSSRNDCRRRRSEREKVINFRQKEKDILDSIIGMSLIFYPKNHKKHPGTKTKGATSYDARIRPASVNTVTNETGRWISEIFHSDPLIRFRFFSNPFDGLMT